MVKKNLTGKALAAAAALTLTLSSLGQSAAVLGNKVSAAETDNYAKLLQQSLFFYDANMCGKTVEKDSLMQWRGNCHTFSEVDGGYHDAGDHAMFGLPQGYTASTLGWAYYEFKDSFEKLGLSAHFKTISDHFATFFKNATVLNGNSVSKICIQKGVGDTDHSYWGAPEKQGNGEFGGCDWRTSGCGDIAAEYAASLAASYVNFGNAEDLTYAKALYNYAKQNQSCSDGDCTKFYKSNSSNDDLAWAATWLYIATKDGSYKNDVPGFKAGYDYWVHGWSNVNEGALILGAEAGINDWSAVQSYLGAYNG
ncbi:MAG: glycoside hydrolase family 9 protein, partial [Oscillospiraceae bacterium]|nr:glycoside hydrolase family 9 protein [Oscillospiraceae bacterium]